MTDADMHRMYYRENLSLMRIAKRFDCRLQDVRDALARADVPKVPPDEMARRIRRDLDKRVAELAIERSGRPAPIRQTQKVSAYYRRKIPITLPKVSILEDAE